MYEHEVCGKVDLLATGHDHSLQWLKPYPKCGSRPQFIISGAAAKSYKRSSAETSYHANRAVWEMYDALGFFWVEASPKSLRIVSYTVDSEGHALKGVDEELEK